MVRAQPDLEFAWRGAGRAVRAEAAAAAPGASPRLASRRGTSGSAQTLRVESRPEARQVQGATAKQPPNRRGRSDERRAPAGSTGPATRLPGTKARGINGQVSLQQTLAGETRKTAGPTRRRPAKARRRFQRPAMIAHVVFFEPRNNLSVSDKEQFLIEIRSSAKNIPSVARARIGRTVSFGVMPKQELGQTEYQYAAIFEFATQEDLQGYLVHPIHDE